MTMPIDVVSASAGTGKTYRLAKEMAEAVLDGGVRPEAIVAITYTNKAAAELARRLRKRLLEAGQPEAAARIREGYLGTVHSVCQRLIRELAFDAGVSPWLKPAPEAFKTTMYRTAVDDALASELGRMDETLAPLSLQTQRDWKGPSYGKADSWREVLHEAVKRAVENRMQGPALEASQQRSWKEVVDLLDAPVMDSERLDGQVRDAVFALEAEMVAKVERNAEKGKPNKSDEKRHRKAKAWADALRDGNVLTWRDLAELGKRKGDWSPKGFDVVLEPVVEAMARHLGHPRLHEDLATAQHEVFGATVRVADSFRKLKGTEGVLDFEDMLSIAADLLQREDVRQHLAGRFELVLVDEFQDTSPVQLQAILGLCAISPRSLWVGDRKQAIFGFQGSDPELMAQAAASVTGEAPSEVLEHNFRSRPPLVEFCSDLFSVALAQDGFAADEVRVAPACPESPELDGEPALRLWRLERPDGAEGTLDEALAMARGVYELIASGLLVRDESDDPTQVAPVRPVRPGDIAILARRNKDCRMYAEGLRRVGLSARVQLDNLGQEPVTWLLRAGLALMVDPRDRLAAAELSWLGGGYAEERSAWMKVRLDGAAGPAAEDHADDLRVQRVRAAAADAWRLSPTEAVDAVLASVDAPRLALGWPDPERGLANLEALRGVARTYEETCTARRVAATVAGLVRHLEGLPEDAPQGLASDDDAVNVVTWHKSKGLEWPVVILTTLDRDLRFDPWALRVRPADTFDPEQPLAGRTLRWWPNPYGSQHQQMVLPERALASDCFAEIAQGLRAEERRLAYVAFTRARDHLILAAIPDETGVGRTGVLDRLSGEEAAPLLELPWDADGVPGAAVRLVEQDTSWPCVVEAVHDVFPDDLAAPPRPRWFDAPGPSEFDRLRLSPSAMLLEGDAAAAVQISEEVRLGDRVAVRVPSEAFASFGDAVHAFFALDRGQGTETAAREASARTQLGGLAVQVDPRGLVETSDRFWTWVRSRWPGAQALCEWPVEHLREDGRFVRGEIDLLLALPGGGFVVIDHKSFPGDRATRDARVAAYAGQLAAYAEAVEAATGEAVVERWIHLPVRGEAVRVEASRGQG